MTGPHLRHLVADVLAKLGVKIATEKLADADKGPPVKMVPMGAADEQANQANLIIAEQSPGFVTAKEVIADVIDHRGDAVMFEDGAAGAGVKYQIDGVWHDMPPARSADSRSTIGSIEETGLEKNGQCRCEAAR